MNEERPDLKRIAQGINERRHLFAAPTLDEYGLALKAIASTGVSLEQLAEAYRQAGKVAAGVK